MIPADHWLSYALALLVIAGLAAAFLLYGKLKRKKDV
jgi:hypothetical protein